MVTSLQVACCCPQLTDCSLGDGVGGRIIFVGANMFHTGLPLQTHVGAAKSAVNSLSNHMAIELGPLGVTSNVIAPGPIGDTVGSNFSLAVLQRLTNFACFIGRHGSTDTCQRR